MTFITDTIAIGNFVDAENRAARESAGTRSGPRSFSRMS